MLHAFLDRVDVRSLDTPTLRLVLDHVNSCLPPLPSTSPSEQEAREVMRHAIGARISIPSDMDLALQVEVYALRGDLREALDRLATLLTTHTIALERVQAQALRGQHLHMRRDPALDSVYRAMRAVLDVWLAQSTREKQQDDYAGKAAAQAAAWLWAHPLSFALIQPPFPKVIQAVYTLLSSVKDAREHVQHVLQTPRMAQVRSHYAGLIALAFANRGAPHIAAQLLDLIWEHGIEPHEAVVRRTARMCAPQRQATVIQPLVTWLESHAKEASSWKWLVLYHAERGDVQAMESALSHLPVHDEKRSYAYLVCEASRGDVVAVHRRIGRVPRNEDEAFWLLRAHVRQDDLSGARDVFTAASSEYASERLYSEMARMLARTGDATEAMHLAAQLEGAGLVCSANTLTYLVQALGRAQLPERAAALMAHHQARGTPLARRVYTALMNAYIRVGHYAAVMGIFKFLTQQRDVALQPDTAVYNTFLKAHVHRGTPVAHVLRSLLDMRRRGLAPDARTYALAVQSACDGRRMSLAEELFALADKSLADGASLELHTIMLHAYLREGETSKARAMLDQVKARGIEPSHVTMGVLIRSYASGTESSLHIAQDLAMQLVAEAQGPRDIDAWRVPALDQGPMYEDVLVPLIDAHGRRGDVWAAEHVFRHLVHAGQPISPRALTALMNAYRYAGDVQGVLRLWDELYDELVPWVKAQVSAADALSANTAGGEEPSIGPYQRSLLCLPLSIVIESASRAGMHDRVAEIWTRAKRDGFAFDAHNWNHLCAALARAHRLRDALHIIEHVLPESPPQAHQRAVRIDGISPSSYVRAAQNEKDEEAFARDPLYRSTSTHVDLTKLGPTHPPHRREQLPASDMTSETTDTDVMRHFLLEPRRQWFATYHTLEALDKALAQDRSAEEALLPEYPVAASCLAQFRHRYPTLPSSSASASTRQRSIFPSGHPQ